MVKTCDSASIAGETSITSRYLPLVNTKAGCARKFGTAYALTGWQSRRKDNVNPLSLIPLKGWLYIGLAVALIAGYAYWHHHVYEQGVASMQAKVDAANLKAAQAMAENANNGTTIAALQASQAQCEAGRIADQVAANKALTDHDKGAALIHAQLVADREKVQALFNKALNPTCSEWAKQAACTP